MKDNKLSADDNIRNALLCLNKWNLLALMLFSDEFPLPNAKCSIN